MKQLTPGEARSFSSWVWMMMRCLDKTSTSFKNYGARGISVCDRWMDPWAFLADMGERPEHFSLGRLDNDGPYCAENCEWQTAMQQGANTRRTVLIGGKHQSAVARELNLSDAAISRRRTSGRAIEDVKYFKRNKLTRDQVAEIKALIPLHKDADIGALFDVGRMTISMIRRGKTWRDVPSKQNLQIAGFGTSVEIRDTGLMSRSYQPEELSWE